MRGKGQVYRADEVPAPPNVCQEVIRLVGMTCMVSGALELRLSGRNVGEGAFNERLLMQEW